MRLHVIQRIKEVQTKFPIDMGLVGMGVTLVQTIASYKQLDLKWTPMLKTTVSGVSASNVNVDLVSPECASSTWKTNIHDHDPVCILIFVHINPPCRWYQLLTEVVDVSAYPIWFDLGGSLRQTCP